MVSFYITCYFAKSKIIRLLSTFYTKLILRIQGIPYGKNVSFRGKPIILKSVGTSIKIGNNCSFNSKCRYNFRGMSHPCILQTAKHGRIIIGDNCGFSGVSIVSDVGVTLGNNVLCGTNVMIGDRNDHEDLYPQFQPEPVVIGNNVWIGMNSVVMKGVTIGDNVIIGANSVVTRDIPSNVIAVGSPCKPIKENK